jgi:branched-chain amino acid transport system ATP-binding protein
MLRVEGIQAFYGRSQALHDFSVEVAAGEVLCLLGRNGAGKTTALKAIMGLVRPRGGRITLDGEDLAGLPAHEIPRRGLGYVPQGRRLFAELSVRENLEIGLMVRGSGQAVLDRALDLFPVLRQRLDQRAGTLSGGEQTMLTIARALCIEPRILLLDEPTEGLMPSMIATIRAVVLQLRDAGVGVLLVEQRVDAVLPVASRVAFMENGRIRATVSIDAVRADDSLLHRYVGVGHAG